MKIRDIIKNNYRQIVLVFVIAYLTRLAYFFSIKVLPTFYSLSLDALVHDTWAMEILFKDFWGNAAFFRAPLYSYFLALIYGVFGHNLFIARLIQIIIGSLSCVLIYILAFKIYRNKAISLISGIIASLYWVFIYFDNELLIPVLIVFLNLSGIIIFLEAIENMNLKALFYSGLIFGLSAISRPNILLFMPFLFVWLFIVIRKDKNLKSSIKFCSIFTIGVCLIVFPITLRNYIIGDDFVLIGSQGGVNFYIGNNPYSDGKTAVVPGTKGTFWGGYHDTNNIAMNDMKKTLLPSEISDYWYKKGIKFILSNPVKTLKLYGKKLSLIFDLNEISNNKNIAFFKNESNILRLPLFFGLSLVFPFALSGMIFSKKDRYWYLITFFVIIYSISILLFFVTSRFRIPILPILIIFASYSIWKIYNCIISKKKSTYIAMIILTIFFFTLLFINSTPQPDLSKTSDGHYIIANAYYRTRKFDKALELFKKTIQLNHPYKSRSYKVMGFCLLQKNKTEEGRQALLTALKEEEVLLDEINNVLLKNGFHTMAFEMIGSTKNLHSITIIEEYFKIADYCMKRNLTGDAEKCYLAVLEKDNSNINAILNLANIYSIDAKNFNKAEKMYKSALEKFPDNKSVMGHMIMFYKRNYMTDEAQALEVKINK